MAHRNDCKLASLVTNTGQTGHTNDLELIWLQGLGATADQLNDAWYEYLTGAGFTGTLNDMQYEWLGTLGATGTLADRWYYFWCVLGGVAGGATLTFSALTYDPVTYEMLGVKEGVGDLATTHTSTIYAKDFEGVYQAFPANAPVWSGGRCVLSAGAGSDVVSVFADSPVGTPLPEVPYLQYYPAATNNCEYSNDQTNARWTSFAIVTKDQVGLTGVPNSACLIDDNSAAVIGDANQENVPITANVYNTVVWYVKKDTDQTRFPAFDIRYGGVQTQRYQVQLNTQTGETFVQFDDGVGSVHEVIDDGDWWKLITSIKDQWSSTNVRVYAFAAITETLGGANTAVATGSIIVGNIEVHSNKTIAEVRGLGPIFTTTAAVATDRTAYSFSASNYVNTLGALYAEVISSTGVADGSSRPFYSMVGFNRVSADRQAIYFHSGSNGEIQTRLPNNRASSINQYYVAGTPYKVAPLYDFVTDIGIQINIDGVWGAKQTDTVGETYRGTNFDVGWGASASYKIRNLQRYDITSYEEGKTIIDGLMG